MEKKLEAGCNRDAQDGKVKCFIGQLKRVTYSLDAGNS